MADQFNLSQGRKQSEIKGQNYLSWNQSITNMNFRKQTPLFSFFIAACWLVSLGAKEHPEKPNFVIVLADDIMDSFDVLVHPSVHHSPYRAGSEWIRFKNMFVSEAMCAPALKAHTNKGRSHTSLCHFGLGMLPCWFTIPDTGLFLLGVTALIVWYAYFQKPKQDGED